MGAGDEGEVTAFISAEAIVEYCYCGNKIPDGATVCEDTEDHKPPAASAGYGLCHRCKAPIHVDRFRKWEADGSFSYKATCSANCGQFSSQLKGSESEAVEDFYSYP
jgi:hypothetical protein